MQQAPYSVKIRGNTIENCTIGINLLDGNDICLQDNRFVGCGTNFFADSDVNYTLKEPSSATSSWAMYE